ncbi:MAG: hypothetical protein HFH40_00355 [Lachnospiraceae bacterium]|nr:hypothetical protein [Lachnospiraceae bacterium]
MKKKSFPITNIGTISLMMIFIVLCMVTFAALSLSSAVSDSRSGQKMSRHTEEYYAASNQAEEILAQMDGVFSSAYGKAQEKEGYYKLVSEGLPDTVTAQEQEGQLEVSYQVDINDSQAIRVQLAVLPPQEVRQGEGQGFYKILSWQEIQTTDWEGDNSIQLIQ